MKTLLNLLNMKNLLSLSCRMLDFAFLSLAMCMLASMFLDTGSGIISVVFSQISVCRGAMMAFKAMK